MAQRAPLIVVLGATACGKSKLAIELAQRFKGEIISADSMQVYKGLDIVTNKVSEEEQQQARHHLINFLDPLVRYSVVDFRNQSLEVITDLHRQNQLPIIVGGTHYYIESLLWKSFLIGPSDETKKLSRKDTIIDAETKLLKSQHVESMHVDEDFEDVEKFFKKPIYNDAFVNTDPRKLWKILEQVDSKAAHLYHPHDRRKLIRSLQIIQSNRKNYSDLLASVNKSGESDQSSLGGPLRFHPTCVLWLNCDSITLEKILDERVDQMLNRGLLAELENFHKEYNRQRIKKGEKLNYDKGVFQSIGFKEFHEYFMLDEEKKLTEEGNDILRRSIEDMKMSTKRYAKRQLKWIKRRFLKSGLRDLPLLFKLDTVFDEKLWSEQVLKPASEIVETILNGSELTDNLLAYKQEPTSQMGVNNPGKYECQVCDRIFIGSHHIEAHLKSKSHQRNARRESALNVFKRQKVSSTSDGKAYEQSLDHPSTNTIPN